MVVRTPAVAWEVAAPVATLDFRETRAAHESEDFPVKRVRFDLEDLREKLENNDESPSDFLELQITEPPRPFGGSGAIRSETEAALEQLRRELQREAEQKRPLQTLPSKTETPQPIQGRPPQREDQQPPQAEPRRQSLQNGEPSIPVATEPQAPQPPEQQAIIPGADNGIDSPSDLSDTGDNTIGSEDGREIEDEAPLPPFMPDMAPEPRDLTGDWDSAGWTLGFLKDDDYGAHPFEPAFCEQLWACAGGRHQSPFQHAMHGMQRDFNVLYVGKCGLCGRYGRGDLAPGARAFCSPTFASRCNVGVGRTRYRQHPKKNPVCAGTCTSPDTCTGCTVDTGSTVSADCGDCGVCSTCRGAYHCRRCRPGMDREPWSAWDLLFADTDPGINVFGWTATGHHNRANGMFNNHPHGFKVHQAWVAFERVADTSRNDFGWGARGDVMYGLDAQDTQAFGSHPSSYDFQNGFDHGVYGWAIPQLYGELAFRETSFMIGHFYTLMGYEVVPAPGNFFYSHSLTMYNSEPFTHTGVLARTSISDYFEWYYGWTLGWDTGFDQLNNGNSFLGGFKWRLTDAFCASYITSAGDFGKRGSGFAQSLVFAANPTEKWGYVFQSDLLRIQGEDNVGVNQYLFYNLNNFISLGSRMEWWKGDTITAFAPFGSTLPASGSHSYYEATVGANIHFGANVVVRPEGRYDWSPAVNYSVGTAGVDAVFTF